MLNWIDWNKTVFICKTMDLELKITYNGWYTIKPNQTKSCNYDNAHLYTV